MPTVMVPLGTGFEELEAVALIDVMRRGGIDVIVASVNGETEAEGAHGIAIRCDRAAREIGADDLDMIVLPGGWGGTKILAGDGHIQALLKEMDAKGKQIGAICAAPFALHKAGVLKPNYTCYPSVEQEIRTEGYLGEQAQVVTDGNVMTSRGPGTAICFGLQIVKKLVGDESYAQVKAGLLATYCE